jgi:hypothetical protein
MILFLLLLATLAAIGIIRTVVLVARDGYGNPSTIPSVRTLDGRLGSPTR